MPTFRLDETRTQYLALLHARYATLHLPLRAGEQALPLQTIFQPLTLRHGPLSFDDPSQVQNGTEVVTALNGTEALALSSSRRMVVLGGPGMGKTTLLKALLQQAIIQAQTEPMAPLPLFISLPDLARSGLTLQAYLPGILAELGIEASYGDVLVEAVNEGRAFLCLDSLDEVVPAQRPDMIALINREAMRCGGTWIIGSRFTEYKGGQFVHSQFAEWELQALDEPMRIELARHLLPALAELLQITPVPAAEDFVQTLSQETRIAAWGENPLLFSLTAIVHVQAGSLPGSRASLYRDIVEIMLGARFSEGAEREELRRLLAEVALELYQTKGRNFTVADLLALLARLYPELSFQKQTEMVGRMLDAGLLDRVAYETYGFKHQMFQEYLCAVALAQRLVSPDTGEQEAAWEFLWRKHLYSRWGEVLRLCVGVLVQEHGEMGSQMAGRWLLRLADEQKTSEGDVGHLCMELALGSVRECASVLYTDELTEVIKGLVVSWVEKLMRLLINHGYSRHGRLERLAEDVKRLDLPLVLPALFRVEEVRDCGAPEFDFSRALGDPKTILDELDITAPVAVLVRAYPEAQEISLLTSMLPTTLRARASKERLMELLQDKEADWQVRKVAASLLDAWEGQGLIELFCTVLEDTSNYYQLRIAAAESLAKLREQMPVERLVSLLQDEDERIRVAIVRALVEAGERLPIETLLMTLNDTEAVVRFIVQWAASNQSEQIASEPLLTALASENDDVRAVTIYLLGSRMPTELLLAALHDPHEQVCVAAVAVAGRSGERIPVTALLEVLRAQKENASLSKTVVRTLCVRGEQVPVEAALNFLWEKGGYTSRLEPEWLDVLRRSIPVDTLINLAQDPKRLRSALAMARVLELAMPVELLLMALGNSEHEIVDIAIRLLGSLGEDAPIPALLDILSDESAPGRSGAVRVLLLLAPYVPTEPILRLHAEVGVPSDLDRYLMCLLLRRGVSLSVESLMRVVKTNWDKYQYGRDEIVIALEDMGALVPIEELLAMMPEGNGNMFREDRVVRLLRNVYEWITPEKLLAAANHKLIDARLAFKVLGGMGKNAPIDFIQSIADDETRERLIVLQAKHALLKAGVNLPLRYFFAERDVYFETVGNMLIEEMRDDTIIAMRVAAIAMMRDLCAQAPIQDLLDIVISDDDRIASVESLGLMGYDGDLLHQVATESLRALVPYLPLERLVAALDHPNPLVRKDVIQILGATGAAAPISKLTAMLCNPDEQRDVRMKIADALIELHRYTPCETVLLMLQDKEESIRRSASHALKLWGSDLSLDLLLPLMEMGAQNSSHRQYEATLREDAIMATGRLQERAPVDLLISLLDSKDMSVAAEALSCLGKDAPLDALIAHLYNTDGDLCTDILWAFASMGESAPFDLIFQLLKQDNASVLLKQDDPGARLSVRQAVIYTLKKLAEAAPAKFITIARENQDPDIRNVLMDAVARLGPDAPADLVLEGLEDTRVYFNACLALLELNIDPALIPLEPLLNGLRGKYTDVSLSVLAKAGSRAPIEPLLALLGSSSIDICENAAKTLYQTHPEVFTEVVQQAEAILSGEPTGGVFASRVQSRVADLVKGLGRATPEVLAMLTEMLGWPYWEVRMKAAQALGTVSRNIPDQAIRRLMELRHDPDSEAVREAADAALAEILSRESGLEDE